MRRETEERIFGLLTALTGYVEGAGAGLNLAQTTKQLVSIRDQFAEALGEEPSLIDAPPPLEPPGLFNVPVNVGLNVRLSALERREHVWLSAWMCVATAVGCTDVETADRWARGALKEFDAKFPEVKITKNEEAAK